MKSYIYSLLFVLALLFAPLANAGQAEDPALANAQKMFDEALICVPPPYYLVECRTFPGGTAEARFHKVNFGEILAQAIQDGSSPREWRVSTSSIFTTPTCPIADNGAFSSKGQGFNPWKRELLDTCAACVNDPECLSLLP